MPVKRYKPTSPGRRFQSVLTRDDLSKDPPEKTLTKGLSKSRGNLYKRREIPNTRCSCSKKK